MILINFFSSKILDFWRHISRRYAKSNTLLKNLVFHEKITDFVVRSSCLFLLSSLCTLIKHFSPRKSYHTTDLLHILEIFGQKHCFFIPQNQLWQAREAPKSILAIHTSTSQFNINTILRFHSARIYIFHLLEAFSNTE